MKQLTIITLLVSLLALSCDNFIDRPPLDQLSEESYWKTPQDLKSYIVKFYPRAFPGHGTYSTASAYVELNSDNMTGRGGPNTTLNGTRGNTGGRWIGPWRNIRSLNIFFDNYKKVNASLDEYKQPLGEAYFFRAWFYFNLVKKYGDVPWYSHEISLEDSVALHRPRDPRTVVVDSILADIDKAVEYVGDKAEVENTRINKEAALAFKTRVALFEGTWQKYHAGTPFGTSGADSDKYFQACVDAGKELITNDNYTKGLYNPTDAENPYFTLFGLSDMGGVNEVLLYKAYNTSDIANDMQAAAKYNQVRGWGITWSLVSSYLSKEGTPYNYRDAASSTKGNAFLTKIASDVDPRLHATIWIPGDLKVAPDETFNKPPVNETGIDLNTTGFLMKKGANPYSEERARNGGGNSDTGYIIFRYGEVLLNYAEAEYELEQVVAYNALNKLRERVGMPDFSVNPKSSYPHPADYGYPISDALRAIRKERRVELAIEDHRDDDYRRWAAHALFKGKRPKGYPFKQSEFPEYHPQLDKNGLIDYYQKTLSGYGFRPDQDYLSPIPTEELTLNPNIKQNPGW